MHLLLRDGEIKKREKGNDTLGKVMFVDVRMSNIDGNYSDTRKNRMRVTQLIVLGIFSVGRHLERAFTNTCPQHQQVYYEREHAGRLALVTWTWRRFA